MTDISRWKALATSECVPVWGDRTEFISTLIDSGATVLDIGCGNQHLKTCINESCSYTPLDCVAGENVIVLDFNSVDVSSILLSTKHDVAVCSGVLEYIHDKSAALNFIHNNSDTAILSYVIKENRNVSNNKTNGWDDGVTNQEFILLLNRSNLQITKQLLHGKHVIYCVKSII